MLEQALQDLTVTWVFVLIALGTALAKLVSKGGDVLFDYIKTRVYFNEKIRQQRNTLKLEQEIKEVNSYNIPHINEVLGVSKILEEILQEFNALRVTLLVYHNGTAKGFKNFSARYQEARSVVEYNMDNYQSRPLSPFYEDLKNADPSELVIYDSVRSKQDKFFLTKEDLDYVILAHILVDSSLLNKEAVVKTGSGKYEMYPVAALVIAIDKESRFDPEDERDIRIIKNRRDALLNLYIKNPQILG